MRSSMSTNTWKRSWSSRSNCSNGWPMNGTATASCHPRLRGPGRRLQHRHQPGGVTPSRSP
jgi:hypothetical protein